MSRQNSTGSTTFLNILSDSKFEEDVFSNIPGLKFGTVDDSGDGLQ